MNVEGSQHETPDQPEGGDQTPPHRLRRKGSVAPRSIRGRIVAGVVLIIPVAVTFILIRWVYQQALAAGILLEFWLLKGLHLAFKIGEAPKPINPAQATWYEIALAVFTTLLTLYLLGWLGTNIVGRRLIDAAENLLERIPFVDTVYGSIKRMVRALLGGHETGSEQRVVFIDFPTDNMKVIGLVTNTIVDRETGRRHATVFVPTTPNPTSGYMELVPVERLTYTDLSMEQALTMILSGGASAPPNLLMRAHAKRAEVSKDAAVPLQPAELSRH